MTDEELVKLSNDGDNAALDILMRRYKNLVKIISRHYFILGADREDISQEGMIGLYKAVREFDRNQATFRTFAELCIKRHILTAIKSAARKKHAPLNQYISISDNFNENLNAVGMPHFDSTLLSPEDIIINREGKAFIESHLGAALSDLEYKVLLHFLQGASYAEISANLDCNEKTVDNALTRIRRKIPKIVNKL